MFQCYVYFIFFQKKNIDRSYLGKEIMAHFFFSLSFTVLEKRKPSSLGIIFGENVS